MEDDRRGKRGALGKEIVAIVAAGVALAMSVVTVVVVAARGSTSSVAVDASPQSLMADKGSTDSGSAAPSIVEENVSASEVVKLRSSLLIEERSGDGIVVTDETLRIALKLEPDDVIVGLNGRALQRKLDVADAMMAMTMAETTTVFVDVIRGGKPVLLRWVVDVSLRSAWRSGAGLNNASISIPQPVIDPTPAMIDAIEKIDALRYAAPRSSLDAIFRLSVTGARFVHSFRNGTQDGVKLYGIRPGSIYAAIGLQSGDTIVSLDGVNTPTAEKLKEVYDGRPTRSQLAVGVTRGSFLSRSRLTIIAITVK